MSYREPKSAATTRRAVMLLLLFVISGAAAGCAAVGVIADKVGGDKPVPAKYTFPKDEAVAILVENYHNPDTVSLSAEIVAREIYDDLKAHDVGPLVDPNRISELRTARGEAFKDISIAGVAKRVDAKHIIYCEMNTFALEPAIGGNTVKGHTQMQVRVVNARSGLTEWPNELSGGTSIKAETAYVQLGDGVDEKSVRDKLIQSLSSQTARLFYAARPSESEDDTPSGPS